MRHNGIPAHGGYCHDFVSLAVIRDELKLTRSVAILRVETVGKRTFFSSGLPSMWTVSYWLERLLPTYRSWAPCADQKIAVLL